MTDAISLKDVLVIFVPLIFGAYLYTWQMTREIRDEVVSLWKAVSHLKDNEIHDLEGRVERMEGRVWDS